jgi:UDP-N-acetylmuramoylalanine--D-glutamate ligase
MEEQTIVAEVSSFQLETIDTFRPKVSAVINITEDHLDRHGTMDEYIAMKARIFENQCDDDVCVLNYDNEHTRRLAENVSCKVLFFSTQQELSEGVFIRNNDIYIKYGMYDETVISLSETPIITENLMTAIAMSACAGLSVQAMREKILAFRAVEHRIEYVTELDGVVYYNDSKATNPSAAIEALRVMKAMGKPVILIGGGFDKMIPFDEWVKSFENVKFLIVMGATADTIIKTCNKYGFDRYEKVNTLRDAMDVAAAKAQSGDCVLLSPACASYGMFTDFEERGRRYKEYVNGAKTI